MAHIHEIADSGLRFIIDARTRQVTAQGDKLKLIQSDHNSKRLTFEMPRFVEGHDMLGCSKVEVHFVNIAADKKSLSADVYPVDDVKVCPDSDDVVIFSWLISGNATRHAGILSFLIKFTCLTGEAVDYVWNTDLYSEITVGEGMNNGEAVIAEYSDVLEKWKAEIFADFTINFEAEKNAAIEEIEAKGAATLATIPEDYTALNNRCERNTSRIDRNDKRITNIEEGLNPDPSFIDDSVAYTKDVPENALPFAEIQKIGGMTYKVGGVLRSAPVTEVVSEGKNLLPFPYYHVTKSEQGVTWTVNQDRSVTVSGTPTGISQFYFVFREPIPSLATKLTFSIAEGSNAENLYTRVLLLDENYSIIAQIDGTPYTPITMDLGKYPNAVYYSAFVSRGLNDIACKGTLFPITNLGPIAKPYSPYTKNTLPIPEAVRPEHGINKNVYDYIEWCEDGTRKKYKRVGCVDMGTLNWYYTDSFGTGVMCFRTASIADAKLAGATDDPNVLCALYSSITANNMSSGVEGITSFGALNGIFVCDSNYTDAATFKAAMQGIMLYYELATPEVTDISDKLSADNFIGVEGGGTITAVNEYKYAVPSTIEFQKEIE